MTTLRLRSAGASHAGHVRRLNEDSWLDRAEIGLWAVADGMGGHDRGDLASRVLRETLADVPGSSSAVTFRQQVTDAITATNTALIAAARSLGPGAVIGTTILALLADGTHFIALWAGDSRLYRFRDGVLQRLSRDHSKIQDLVDAGRIAEADAEQHPMASILTRAVGVEDELVLDRVGDRLETGDILILATDGLYRMVDEKRIAEIAAREPPDLLPQALVDAALAGGGRDNVTVVAVAAAED